MHGKNRKLRRNLRSKLASTFDSEFALELGTTMELGKDKNPLEASRSHSDITSEIDLSMRNGSGLQP